jgi:hypothetical protein
MRGGSEGGAIMIATLTSLWSWIAGRFTAWGLGSLLSLSFLGPLAPILTGIANAIGAAITAIFEILVSLSKSPEGRVVLGLAAAGLTVLYLRFHYIEEGRTLGRTAGYTQGVARGKQLAACPKTLPSTVSAYGRAQHQR